MARLTLKDGSGTVLTDDGDVIAHLKGIGIHLERWPLEGLDDGLLAKEVWDDADKETLLEAYADMRERMKGEGYIAADVVALHQNVPGLDGMLAKFDKEHYHTDDELRFIAAGEGIFGFNPENGPEVELLVEAGDYINVPQNVWHWFTLTDARRIVAIRFFMDQSGWVPHYRES